MGVQIIEPEYGDPICNICYQEEQQITGVKTVMVDIDGTNLIEKFSCPKCPLHNNEEGFLYDDDVIEFSKEGLGLSNKELLQSWLNEQGITINYESKQF